MSADRDVIWKHITKYNDAKNAALQQNYGSEVDEAQDVSLSRIAAEHAAVASR